jgi:hypothetical protein
MFSSLQQLNDRVLRERGIGPIGTALRVIAGAGLIYYVGAADGGGWDVGWLDAVLGFVALPAVMIVIGMLASRYADGPLRFDGPLGHLGNLAVIAALVLNPVTAAGAGLFYGATMLIAAWRGQAGCEASVVSNLLLRRNDQLGCPIFLPIDLLEARSARTAARA